MSTTLTAKQQTKEIRRKANTKTQKTSRQNHQNQTTKVKSQQPKKQNQITSKI